MNEIELNSVPDESEKAKFGLNTKELKERLKHIAGLCYGLACDITNTEIEADFLRRENEYLRQCLKEAGIKQFQAPPASVETRMRRERQEATRMRRKPYKT